MQFTYYAFTVKYEYLPGVVASVIAWALSAMASPITGAVFITILLLILFFYLNKKYRVLIKIIAHFLRWLAVFLPDIIS